MDAVRDSQHEQRILLPGLGDGASVTAQPGPPPGLSRVSVSHGGLSRRPST